MKAILLKNKMLFSYLIKFFIWLSLIIAVKAILLLLLPLIIF